MKNIRLAAKKFKRGMSAKPLYDLNRNILDLIHDLTSSKLPLFRMMSKQDKKYIAKKKLIFRANFLLTFTYLKGKFFILFYFYFYFFLLFILRICL